MYKSVTHTLLLFIGIFCQLNCFCQTDSLVKSYWSSFELGFGSTSYFGDLRIDDINRLGYVKPAVLGGFEQRFFGNVGLNLNATVGTIEYSQRDLSGSINFKSNITSLDFICKYYLDNNFIISRNALFSPYLGVGVSYLMFDPKGDLKDQNGNEYHFWSDGTIRDAAESNNNESGKIISRDYEYETSLSNSNSPYEHFSYSVPVQAGLKFKLSNSFETNLGIIYYITKTDFIDNINTSSGNDKILLTSVSLNYKLGFKKPDIESEFNNIDFAAIENRDEDNDGIADIHDECQQTPADIKVNGKGCPEDSDNDGIPDYLDKEIKSGKGTSVSNDGVSITDQFISEMLAKDSVIDYKFNFERIEVRDSIARMNFIEKTIIIGKNGQKLTEKKVVEKMPKEIEVADYNKDGQIKPDEIMRAIDAFFDEDPRITMEVINLLIDHFFNH